MRGSGRSLQDELAMVTTTTSSPTAQSAGVPAQMTTPAPGSTLTASTVQFQWTGGTNVVAVLALHSGDASGRASSYYSTRINGTSLSATVSGLPGDASTRVCPALVVRRGRVAILRLHLHRPRGSGQRAGTDDYAAPDDDADRHSSTAARTVDYMVTGKANPAVYRPATRRLVHPVQQLHRV